MQWKSVTRSLVLALSGAAVGCSSDSGGPSPVPTTLTLVGTGQSGMIGTLLANPVGVTVRDQDGTVMAGVTVTFAVTAGNGEILPANRTVATNSQGTATAPWILGNVVGSNNNSVAVTVANYAAGAETITASATPLVSAYQIDLEFLTPMSPTQAAAFTSAAARWAGIIVGDLPSDRVVADAGECFDNSPAQDEVIDDLLIFASVDSIDGPGGILGGASPCWIRDEGFLTIVGGMVFDSADMAQLEVAGILEAVILHEMGHVLGIGTLWSYMNPSLLVGAGTVNPYFNGANGVFRFGLDGGGTYPGTPVPVENQGGPGTADGHWRETIMGRELMTGYISLIANPLSTITVGSLADMAYTVSYANADPYTVSGINLRMEPAAGEMHLRELKPRFAPKRTGQGQRPSRQ